MKKSWKYLLTAATALTLVACADDSDIDNTGGDATGDGGETVSAGGVLGRVQDRGEVIVAVNDQLPGFGYVDDGEFTGFDIDFARAIAAGVLGDADAVEFVPTSAQERFTVVQTGEVDVLVRNTTWTTNRDAELAQSFAPVIFYDGQGIMAPADSGIETLEDLDGMTIGVETGTTTEQNLADHITARDVDIEVQTYDDRDAVIEAYSSGAIDAWTTDRSGLASALVILDEPDAHVILEETLSKEPLAPSVLHGDDEWKDAITWIIFATIQAEEFGITSENVDDFLDDPNPDIQRLLGQEDNLGEQLGLENDFAYQVISQVGNYGEIYERHLGPDTPLNLPRGLNELQENGGLHYSMPFR
jgi:general L-amino acid transport system substrate-binding protein